MSDVELVWCWSGRGHGGADWGCGCTRQRARVGTAGTTHNTATTRLSHVPVSAEGVGCVHCCVGLLLHHHRVTLIDSAGCIVGCFALASHEIKLKYVMRGKNLRCGRETASFPDPAHSICFPSGYTVVFLILVKVYERNLKLVLELSNKWMVRFS